MNNGKGFLKVASWNIGGFNLATSSKNSVKNRRLIIEKICDELFNVKPDVVFIQENTFELEKFLNVEMKKRGFVALSNARTTTSLVVSRGPTASNIQQSKKSKTPEKKRHFSDEKENDDGDESDFPYFTSIYLGENAQGSDSLLSDWQIRRISYQSASEQGRDMLVLDGCLSHRFFQKFSSRLKNSSSLAAEPPTLLFRFINVHLESNSFGGDPKAEQRRWRQIEEAKRMIQVGTNQSAEPQQKELPCTIIGGIIGGDTNLSNKAENSEFSLFDENQPSALKDAWLEIVKKDESYYQKCNLGYSWDMCQNDYFPQLQGGDPYSAKIRYDRLWICPADNDGQKKQLEDEFSAFRKIKITCSDFEMFGMNKIPQLNMCPSDHYGISATFSLDFLASNGIPEKTLFVHPQSSTIQQPPLILSSSVVPAFSPPPAPKRTIFKAGSVISQTSNVVSQAKSSNGTFHEEKASEAVELPSPSFAEENDAPLSRGASPQRCFPPIVKRTLFKNTSLERNEAPQCREATKTPPAQPHSEPTTPIIKRTTFRLGDKIPRSPPMVEEGSSNVENNCIDDCHALVAKRRRFEKGNQSKVITIEDDEEAEMKQQCDSASFKTSIPHQGSGPEIAYEAARGQAPLNKGLDTTTTHPKASLWDQVVLGKSTPKEIERLLAKTSAVSTISTLDAVFASPSTTPGTQQHSPTKLTKRSIDNGDDSSLEEVKPIESLDCDGATSSCCSSPPMSIGADGFPTERELVRRSARCKKQTKEDEELPPLSPEQENVLQLALQGYNILITGGAGTGKSVVLKHIIKRLQQRRSGGTAVTASTGIAALPLKGKTFHSWASLGLYEYGTSISELVARVKRTKRAMKSVEETQILIIDEVSMLQPEFFQSMEGVSRRIRGNNKPFGGIQLILCGDFLQLPPVETDQDRQTKRKKGLDMNLRYAFETECWPALNIKVCLLETIFRQQDDEQFVKILNDVRTGSCSDATMRALMEHSVSSRTAAKVFPNPAKVYSQENNASKGENNEHVMRLYSLRRQTEDENCREFSKLTSPVAKYTAKDEGANQALIDQLKKGCRAPDVLNLRKGARVMLVKNVNVAQGLVNGALGTVIGFVPCETVTETMELLSICRLKEIGGNNFPVVHFDNIPLHPPWVIVEPTTWSIESYEKHQSEPTTLAQRTQLPLMLSWAVTIHKSQGMTLDFFETDVSKSFEDGQVYVALSRARTLRGVRLFGFSGSCVRACPRALRFYQDLLKSGEGDVKDISSLIEERIEFNDSSSSSSSDFRLGDIDVSSTSDEEEIETAKKAPSLLFHKKKGDENTKAKNRKESGRQASKSSSKVQQGDIVFSSPCGHTCTVMPVKKEGGTQQGNWVIRISGPKVTGVSGIKTIYCKPTIEAARQQASKFIGCSPTILVIS